MARENIHILLEKSDEREFLFGLQVCADMELLVQVTRVSQDFFVCVFLSWRLISSLKGVEEYCWLVTWVPVAHSECCRQASWPF
jgi:hypothetical protein